MILEKLTSLSFDKDRNIQSVWFLNAENEEIGRGSTVIAINAASRLLALIEELYQEYSDGYERTHTDPIVTEVKIKWEETNPIKCDLKISAKSTKFGNYSIALASPSTVHITELNRLIRRISDAAFIEFASYDKAVPAYTEPVYEQRSLFQSLPDLSLVKSESVAA